MSAPERCTPLPDDAGPSLRAARERRPLTDAQRQKIALLATCTYLPGSYVKRFVRDIHTAAQSPDYAGLTPAQAHLLDETYYHYRKQISGYVETHRMTYPNPPLFEMPPPLPHVTHPEGAMIEVTPDWREIRREQAAQAKLEAWRKKVLGDDGGGT